MVGMRFAEAGMLGRRNSTADEGLGVELSGDVVLTGDARSLCVDDGTGGGALFGTGLCVAPPSTDRLGRFASPGKAIAPCCWLPFLAFESCVFHDGVDVAAGVGVTANFSMLSTCAAVRVFLFGMLSFPAKEEVGEFSVWIFSKAEVEAGIEVELRIPDFSSETWSHRGGSGGAVPSSGFRGAKPSVVAA
jgi:hypothetical protein